MVTGVPFERDVRVIKGQALSRRRPVRRPVHRFNVVTKPYQIQPCGIAPVLPGETLQHAMIQSQIWSDPLASGMKNIGWWTEFFGFYVRHNDLTGWDTQTTGIGQELVDMMTLNASMASFQDATGTAWSYTYPGAIDYVQECTKSCVGAYFRDEGESWNTYTLDSVPLAAIYGGGQSDWTDKLTMASAYADRSVAMPTDVGSLDNSIVEFHALRDAGLVSMDYDDWMRTYGGSAPMVGTSPDSPRFHKPELVFHFREWSYPSNTVEPTTGVPATAVGWRVAAENKKRVFCDQPGWIIWFNVCRPKVYMGKQQGAVAGLMQDRLSWLPAVLNAEHDLGHKLCTATDGPLAAVMTANYYVDLRDLLNYGDQFINYATPATGNTGVPFMALPTSAGVRRYASSAEIMALFSDTVNGRIRQDGVLSLSVATHTLDHPIIH